MSSAIKAAWSAALLVLVLLAPGLARAQEPRIFASFTPAAVAVSGETELGLGGTVGYRFTEQLWFEGDVTWIDTAARQQRLGLGGHRGGIGPFYGYLPGRPLPPVFPDVPGLPVLPELPELPEFPDIRTAVDGHILIGTIGIRFEPSVQTPRFRPYISGGIGLNHTDRELTIDATPLTPLLVDSLSHTGLAFSGGAGASIQVYRALWATVDAKYFRLSNDRNVMRFGGGATVRF